MAETIRWGIIGTGAIAHKFAEGLKSVSDAELVAVASRTQEKADAFGEEFGVARRHAGYERLAADDGVDAVYVATPHAMHKADTMLCLEAGRAVLCEKPFAINEAEAREMVGLARQKGVFLMEAMWSRFLPKHAHLRELLSAGAIGEPRLLVADFGFRAPFDPKRRLFDPALGGGALLDVGVYNVSLASMVFLEEPNDVAALADRGATGVDEQMAYALAYDGGRLASLSTAVRTTTAMEATVYGTEGFIRVDRPWWCGASLTVTRGGEAETVELPHGGNGYNYEAEEVGRCLREGRTESAVMSLDETLSIMRTLDRLRADIGLRYPME